MKAFVYVIGPDKGNQKIGKSIWPPRRLANIQSTSPIKLRLHHSREVEDAGAVEKRAHHILRAACVHGEWFTVTPKEAVAVIDQAVASLATDALEAAERAKQEAARLERIDAEIARLGTERERLSAAINAEWAKAFAEFEVWRVENPQRFEAEMAKLEERSAALRAQHKERA